MSINALSTSFCWLIASRRARIRSRSVVMCRVAGVFTVLRRIKTVALRSRQLLSRSAQPRKGGFLGVAP